MLAYGLANNNLVCNYLNYVNIFQTQMEHWLFNFYPAENTDTCNNWAGSFRLKCRLVISLPSKLISALNLTVLAPATST